MDRAHIEGVQLCVLVRINEKLYKMTAFCKLIKFYKSQKNIQSRVQAVSPKAYIGALLSIRRWIEHILKVCNVVFWFELMKNCKNDSLS